MLPCHFAGVARRANRSCKTVAQETALEELGFHLGNGSNKALFASFGVNQKGASTKKLYTHPMLPDFFCAASSQNKLRMGTEICLSHENVLCTRNVVVIAAALREFIMGDMVTNGMAVDFPRVFLVSSQSNSVFPASSQCVPSVFLACAPSVCA